QIVDNFSIDEGLNIDEIIRMGGDLIVETGCKFFDSSGEGWDFKISVKMNTFHVAFS
ncbi:hypothetical protein TNCV_233621, partial [Trichonephila clavipes]